jgi:hypothetical protein
MYRGSLSRAARWGAGAAAVALTLNTARTGRERTIALKLCQLEKRARPTLADMLSPAAYVRLYSASRPALQWALAQPERSAAGCSPTTSPTSASAPVRAHGTDVPQRSWQRRRFRQGRGAAGFQLRHRRRLRCGGNRAGQAARRQSVWHAGGGSGAQTRGRRSLAVAAPSTPWACRRQGQTWRPPTYAPSVLGASPKTSRLACPLWATRCKRAPSGCAACCAAYGRLCHSPTSSS